MDLKKALNMQYVRPKFGKQQDMKATVGSEKNKAKQSLGLKLKLCGVFGRVNHDWSLSRVRSSSITYFFPSKPRSNCATL